MRLFAPAMRSEALCRFRFIRSHCQRALILAFLVYFGFRDTPVSSSPAITFLATSVARSASYNSPLETRPFIVAPLCRTFGRAACGHCQVWPKDSCRI